MQENDLWNLKAAQATRRMERILERVVLEVILTARQMKTWVHHLLNRWIVFWMLFSNVNKDCAFAQLDARTQHENGAEQEMLTEDAVQSRRR